MAQNSLAKLCMYSAVVIGVLQEVDEEERRAPTSRGRLESIMWDMMLSSPPRLLERKEKWMKKNEDPLQVVVDHKA